ncbi:hypothetical protein [Enterococcus hirae]|uniref:hypothetical protein n=2 Tax=Enterococcus hirae TaxID=1354 RepID=UPI001094C82E|nr:hypothetical protein [Enterococcus hirae]MDL4889341.1 hypothetical protein [Enterococcus hirae]MDL4892007.1 hypothetical protein [Enterococcus hirae]MDL4898144.1 hypothetical protein [Enterococcus hirae]MDL4900731.1 hypothetical protein [Enterococcus hirae]MDL4903364.1 hypothetical protein [Enterococcus hirae]
MHKKIYKSTITIFLVVVFLFSGIRSLEVEFVNFNFDPSSKNFFSLCLIFFIYIVFIIVVYYFMIRELKFWVINKIDSLCEFLIKENKIRLALFLVRIRYNILKIFSFLNLRWPYYHSINSNQIWKGISKLTIFQKFIIIIRMFSLPVILSIILTLFTSDIINMEWLYIRCVYFLKSLKQLFTITINFENVFSWLPSIAALLTILPILFFFYFYSQKREFRKIINKNKQKRIETVVNKHYELSKLISSSIYEITENLNYVINCQALLVDLILNKKIDNIYELSERNIYRNRNIEKFNLKEISQLEKISKIITELTNLELDDFTWSFSKKRYEMRYLYLNFYLFRNSETLNHLFLTKQGIETIISNVSSKKYSKEQFIKTRNKEIDIFTYNIYRALTMLYALKRYNDFLDRYLNSSNLEIKIINTLLKDQ